MLVDFWTYTCINWLRTLGYVRAWAEQVPGPRAGRGRGPHAGVPVRAGRRQRPRGGGRTWTFAIRSRSTASTRCGSAFGESVLAGRVHRRRAGPDPAPPVRRGRLRGVRARRPQPLREAGRDDDPDDLVSVAAEGFEAQADWANLRDARDLPRLRAGPEPCVSGSRCDRRAANLFRPGFAAAQPVGSLRGLDDQGPGERARTGPAGKIAFRFHARDVNLVMSPPARRYLRDVPGARRRRAARADAHGLDVDEDGRGTRRRAAARSWSASRARSPTAPSRSHSRARRRGRRVPRRVAARGMLPTRRRFEQFGAPELRSGVDQMSRSRIRTSLSSSPRRASSFRSARTAARLVIQVALVAACERERALPERRVGSGIVVLEDTSGRRCRASGSAPGASGAAPSSSSQSRPRGYRRTRRRAP